MRRLTGARRAGVVVLTASLVGHAGNYAFYVIAARMLTLVEFAAISALVALATIAFMPFNGIQVAVARDVAVLRTSGREADLSAYLRRLGRRIGLVCLGILIVPTALSPVLADLLNLRSAQLVILTAVWITVVTVLLMTVGFAQGSERFGHVAFALAGPLGMLRAVLLPLCIVVAGVSGGIWAMIGAAVIGLAVLLPPMVRGAMVPSAEHRTLPSATVTVLALLAFSSLTNVDVLVAQAALAESDRAHYAGAVLLGKIALFAPSALTLVLLPRATAALERGHTADRAVLKTIAVTVACGLGIAGLLWVMPTAVLTATFGPDFAASKPLLAPLALVMTAAAVLWVHLTFATARRSSQMTVLMLGAAVAHWGMLALLHGSPGQIILASAVTAVTTLVVIEVSSASGIVRMIRRLDRPGAPVAVGSTDRP